MWEFLRMIANGSMNIFLGSNLNFEYPVGDLNVGRCENKIVCNGFQNGMIFKDLIHYYATDEVYWSTEDVFCINGPKSHFDCKINGDSKCNTKKSLYTINQQYSFKDQLNLKNDQTFRKYYKKLEKKDTKTKLDSSIRSAKIDYFSKLYLVRRNFRRYDGHYNPLGFAIRSYNGNYVTVHSLNLSSALQALLIRLELRLRSNTCKSLNLFECESNNFHRDNKVESLSSYLADDIYTVGYANLLADLFYYNEAQIYLLVKFYLCNFKRLEKDIPKITELMNKRVKNEKGYFNYLARMLQTNVKSHILGRSVRVSDHAKILDDFMYGLKNEISQLKGNIGAFNTNFNNLNKHYTRMASKYFLYNNKAVKLHGIKKLNGTIETWDQLNGYLKFKRGEKNILNVFNCLSEEKVLPDSVRKDSGYDMKYYIKDIIRLYNDFSAEMFTSMDILYDIENLLKQIAKKLSPTLNKMGN